MLSIGQVASYAGTTVRAVRHYHAVGLLPEPERDASGYRRYGARAAADLVKIRVLAGAGVPLSRVRELLEADDAAFADAVDDVDRRLRAEVRELQQHRRLIRDLAGGDALALPPEATTYLVRLRELGFSQPLVEAERDAWVLVTARVPDLLPDYMAVKLAQLSNPEDLAFLRRLDEALAWESDDPRVVAIADHLAALLDDARAHDPTSFEVTGMDDELIALLDDVFVDSVPMAPRLLALLEERGWRGWTRFQPVDDGALPARG